MSQKTYKKRLTSRSTAEGDICENTVAVDYPSRLFIVIFSQIAVRGENYEFGILLFSGEAEESSHSPQNGLLYR